MDDREVIARAVAGLTVAGDLEAGYAAADRAIAALEASGRVIVPVEATAAMVAAACAQQLVVSVDGYAEAGVLYPDDAEQVWQTMIAAAKDQTDGR